MNRQIVEGMVLNTYTLDECLLAERALTHWLLREDDADICKRRFCENEP